MKPYIDSQIVNLTDEKVTITGLLVSKSETSFVLDDGTGQLTVLSSPEAVEPLPINCFLRIYGTKIGSQEGTINAEIIQNLSGIDKYLYNQVRNTILNGKKEGEQKEQE